MKTIFTTFLNLLHLTQQWIDAIEINHPNVARRICQLIPDRCPFEHKIDITGYTLLYIPPLCKLNPFYQQFITLRLKALTYLAQQQQET